MALFIKANARHFLGSLGEMTSYTDALSVITTLTTSSRWYCVAAFWWCLVLHLLKSHVPRDYLFSCMLAEHTPPWSIQDYTRWLIFLAEHWSCTWGRNFYHQYLSKFSATVCLSQQTPGLLVAHQGKIQMWHHLAAEKTKHLSLCYCHCTPMKKAKTDSDSAHCLLLATQRFL